MCACFLGCPAAKGLGRAAAGRTAQMRVISVNSNEGGEGFGSSTRVYHGRVCLWSLSVEFVWGGSNYTWSRTNPGVGCGPFAPLVFFGFPRLNPTKTPDCDDVTPVKGSILREEI